MDRRRLLTFLTGAVVGVGTALAAIPFFKFMSKPPHVNQPFHDYRVKFPKLKPGQMVSVATTKDLIYVARRTPEQIKSLNQRNEKLRDPNSLESDQPEYAVNSHRSINPEYFIAHGVCMHLGCSTSHISPNNDEANLKEILPNGGYHCPCHGSIYDSAGRVYKSMPAKRNLVVPKYEFIDETTIRFISV